MFRNLFNLLVVFSVISLTCFVLFLLHTKDHLSFIVPKSHFVAEGKKVFSWGAKRDDKQALLSTVTVENPSNDRAQTPASVTRTSGLCPEVPPDLVGPLYVGFDFSRTLEDVRTLFNSSLKEGGRFKPRDCVAEQKVAIIIPFRNRHEHLKHWLYYLHPILMRQQVDYGVYVINQDGDGVFNRAKLMNAGYVEALKDYDYDCFVFSDVDLVPLDDRNLYRCYDNPRHLAVAMDKFNFRLPYRTYFGGVCSMSKDQFLKINGFPNTYWGWGGEDDDIYKRVILRGMSVSRPNYVIGKYRMVRHERDLHNEPNPVNPDKLFRTRWTLDTDGINSLKYTVKAIEKDILFTFITVDIDAPSA